jgi:outer membrane protein OmpA-like peptidoglycan-associated protein
MRCSALLLCFLLVACGSKANRTCTPIPSFSAPAGECVALAEAPKPPPKPKPIEKPPEPEPEPEPEPPKPEPEPEPPPPVVVTADKIELDRTVQFESGKAKLVEDSKTLLGDVAKVLTEHDEILLVQIEGHTDAVGSNRKNKKLSDQRAKAVRAFLIAGGINKKRLVAKGFGEDKPVADNGTEDGRFKNRRVDLKILKRDESKVKPDAKTSEKTSEDEPKAKKKAADEEDDDKADDEAEDEKPAKKKKPKPKAKKK